MNRENNRMDTASQTQRNTRLPDGYQAIPIHEGDQAAPLRLCVLVRQTPDPVAGHFVLLRDLHDAMIYLGCVADAGGRVREWIELWVQNVDGLESSLPAYRETFSNHSLDARWKKNAEQLRASDPEGFLQTGWESAHPLPSFLNLSKAAPLHPGGGSEGGRWELCRADESLRAAGLPAFGTSLFRYLHQPAAGAEPRFVPVVAGAPQNDKTRPLAEALGGAEHHLPFNPQGGLMMACAFGPLAFDEYADLLGGKAWKGIEHGKKFLKFSGVYSGLDDWSVVQQTGAHLFLGPHGRAGRFIETFHLKLQLLCEAVQLTRAVVREQQLPFLNLGADSFRVRLGEAGAGLPFLWTGRCLLVKPSHAYALPVESSEFNYFIRARAEGTSIYLPEGISASRCVCCRAVKACAVVPPAATARNGPNDIGDCPPRCS